MKREVSKREYKGEKYWNFNLKDSILKFVEEYKEKPCKNCSDNENDHVCTKTPLHLSYIYVTENKDGMFLLTFSPSKISKMSVAQMIFLDEYFEMFNI